MKQKINDLNMSNEFYIVSRATSYEEEGNDIYYLAKQKLEEKQIPYTKHSATKLEKDDYQLYDYFVCMDESNIKNVLRIFEEDPNKKIFKLLDLTEHPKDISDPWYTRNFEETYNELDRGIHTLINQILKK